MRATRLLVTGFGPFPTVPRNPSSLIAGRVAASPRLKLLGVDARWVIITTAYAALQSELDPALATRPDAVLMIGVASRSAVIRVERRATSRRSLLFPDAEGHRAQTGRRKAGYEARLTRASPGKVLRLLRRRDLPSRISRDAGRYLCNAAYFRALAAPCPVVFIHMPKLPRVDRVGPRRRGPDWTWRFSDALVDVSIELLRETRAARVERGTALR